MQKKSSQQSDPQSIVSQTRTGFLFHWHQGISPQRFYNPTNIYFIYFHRTVPSQTRQVPEKQDPYILTSFKVDKFGPRKLKSIPTSDVSIQRSFPSSLLHSIPHQLAVEFTLCSSVGKSLHTQGKTPFVLHKISIHDTVFQIEQHQSNVVLFAA